MKPELEQQKQIAAEAWAEAERKFLAAVKLKYAAGYMPTEREKHIGILVELFSLLYLRAKAGAHEEALRIQFDIWAANAGVHRAYIDTIFVRAFGAVRVGTDYWQARRWCEDALYELTEPMGRSQNQ